ncbi:MAG TPA: hypothetical protein DCL86_08715 [Bacteroidales bacterium]|nr:hypothetical protein [Bacteroidales bacterium]
MVLPVAWPLHHPEGIAGTYGIPHLQICQISGGNQAVISKKYAVISLQMKTELGWSDLVLDFPII